MKECLLITDLVQWPAVFEIAVCIATLIIPVFFSFSLHIVTRPVYESRQIFVVPVQKQLLNYSVISSEEQFQNQSMCCSKITERS